MTSSTLAITRRTVGNAPLFLSPRPSSALAPLFVDLHRN